MSGEDTILVTLTHTIEAIPKYGDIKAHRDLPDAFHAVTECRQLVRNIVKALQGPIKKGPKSDSYKAVEKSLNDCKDKAAGLLSQQAQTGNTTCYLSELLTHYCPPLMHYCPPAEN